MLSNRHPIRIPASYHIIWGYVPHITRFIQSQIADVEKKWNCSVWGKNKKISQMWMERMSFGAKRIYMVSFFSETSHYLNRSSTMCLSNNTVCLSKMSSVKHETRWPRILLPEVYNDSGLTISRVKSSPLFLRLMMTKMKMMKVMTLILNVLYSKSYWHVQLNECSNKKCSPSLNEQKQ